MLKDDGVTSAPDLVTWRQAARWGRTVQTTGPVGPVIAATLRPLRVVTIRLGLEPAKRVFSKGYKGTCHYVFVRTVTGE